MTLFLIIIFFFIGYYYATWRNKKKVEIARLLGVKDFISSYCERLRKMCDLMLEKVETESLETEKQTSHAHMLSVLANVHDELIEIWKDEGEGKLAELLQMTVS